MCVCVLVAQSCPTLCDPMNCSPPGSSVQGILQARILKWIAIPFSREGAYGEQFNRGAWWTTIHVVAESDRTEQLTLSLFPRVVKGVPAGWSAIEGSWRAGH